MTDCHSSLNLKEISCLNPPSLEVSIWTVHLFLCGIERFYVEYKTGILSNSRVSCPHLINGVCFPDCMFDQLNLINHWCSKTLFHVVGGLKSVVCFQVWEHKKLLATLLAPLQGCFKFGQPYCS